jgi:3-dehydroshikimate dehydratase
MTTATATGTWTLSAFADEAGGSTDEQVAALKRGGLSHIDLRNVDGHNITVLPLDLAEQVQKKLEAAGIKVNMYGSPIGKIDIADDLKIDLDKLEHLGKLKAIFGCSAVRIFSYFNKAGADKKAWEREAIDRLKRLRDKANQLGLVLYHENESHIFGDHVDDVVKLGELRDGETFKLIYDFANYIRTDKGGWETWELCREVTDCFHFKDQQKNGQHVPMGQGETDAQRIVSDAASRGWSGPCTIEPHLTHSKAVLATGVTGTGSKALADMTPAETFQVAVDGAKEVLGKAGVRFV